MSQSRHWSQTLNQSLSGMRSIYPWVFAWVLLNLTCWPWEIKSSTCFQFIFSLPSGFHLYFLGPAIIRKGGFLGCFLGSHVGRRVALILVMVIITITITNIECCVPSAQYVLDTVARIQQTLSHWILATVLCGWVTALPVSANGKLAQIGSVTCLRSHS